jgi:hypothetical protein
VGVQYITEKNEVLMGYPTVVSEVRLEEIFFLYEVIEKTKLYFSMLFDRTSTNKISIRVVFV